MTVQIKGIHTTQKAVEFYNLYKDMFGCVKKATLSSIPNDSEYHRLRLENEYKEELIFDYAFASGYYGEGARGLLKVLTLAGFDTNLDFIANNKKFTLLR